jgi:inorganic pyrophosphatase
MFGRIFVLGLAIAFAFAQPQTTSTTPPTPTPTGGNHEYMKLMKGDLFEDPTNFRVYLQDAKTGNYLSCWHDIPMFFDQPNNILNMVVEIKRGEGMFSEINTLEKMNPIMVRKDQNGQPIQENIDYIHHMGSIPQTWTSANVTDQNGFVGDNTVLDCIEISDNMHEIGDVVPVKVLGVLGVMLDQQTIDYKIIAIDINAQFAGQVNTLSDVVNLFPDLLEATRGFFRYFKYPETLQQIAFNGEYKDIPTAMGIIQEKNNLWQQLIQNPSPPMGLITQCHQPNAAFPADDADWKSTAESS